MSHDMSDGPDSGQPDEQSVTDGAATGTDVKGGGGKNDFESFVRTALTSMQRTMKKQQSSTDRIAQSQITIKTDIKSINKTVSNLTSRVGAMESSLET